jgi:ribonucleoside-diphosphate reductase beta chain
MSREFEHQRGYSLLNETLGFPDAYYTDFLKHKETAEKNLYMQDDVFKDNFGLSLAKGILLEGISLFGSFIMLKNFERLGKYLGMTQINDWSLKDESLHVEGNSKLFREWCKEHPNEVNDTFKRHIYSMAREIVELEKLFIEFAFSTYRPGNLEPEEVERYIEFIADRRLIQLGLKGNYGITTNPLPWFDEITSGSSVQNFFEGRVTEYAVDGLTGTWSY